MLIPQICNKNPQKYPQKMLAKNRTQFYPKVNNTQHISVNGTRHTLAKIKHQKLLDPHTLDRTLKLTVHTHVPHAT